MMKKKLFMENMVGTQRLYTAEDKGIRMNVDFRESRGVMSGSNEIIDLLISEGGESLYNYIDWLRLARDENMIVLSSQRHYYYSEEELRNVITIINLKQLNQVRNPEEMVQSIFKIMQPKCNFVGFFAESSKHLEPEYNIIHPTNGSKNSSDALEHGIVSKSPLLNRIYNLIDFRTSRYLERKDVYNLFETNGFKVIDMTELNGLTYFCAQKVLIRNE
jgi:uncharacterized protein YfbU (UPF0304 family)